MQSGQLAFGKGDFTREIPCAHRFVVVVFFLNPVRGYHLNFVCFSVQKGEGLSNHVSFTFKHAWKQN